AAYGDPKGRDWKFEEDGASVGKGCHQRKECGRCKPSAGIGGDFEATHAVNFFSSCSGSISKRGFRFTGSAGALARTKRAARRFSFHKFCLAFEKHRRRFRRTRSPAIPVASNVGCGRISYQWIDYIVIT